MPGRHHYHWSAQSDCRLVRWPNRYSVFHPTIVYPRPPRLSGTITSQGAENLPRLLEGGEGAGQLESLLRRREDADSFRSEFSRVQILPVHRDHALPVRDSSSHSRISVPGPRVVPGSHRAHALFGLEVSIEDASF